MKYVVLLFFLIGGVHLFGQPHRFEKDIQAFEAQDQQTPPPAGAILFTGSSSIVFWNNLPQYYPDKVILKRGFGGSELSDVHYFADRVIIRYRPKQVVVYAGENDIAGGKQTARQTAARLVDLFRYVRKNLPNATFTFIAIKLSPSRRQYWPAMDDANRRIRRFLARQSNTQFVDIRPAMAGPDGQPISELFRSDSLHMTEKGYQRWAPVLRPYLK
ncbi:MAG TPA: GDSL-type esterase/lipase family protein [Spirosoma sp.]|jgi:lysophospholipase L1-like esterase|nr:GDSL-type esterase/lipase family protein [Spirosoma sp.]